MKTIQGFAGCRILFCDKFVINGEKSIETSRLGILIFEKAYAIIAIGEKK